MSNSLIRSYLQPCTNAEWGMKGIECLSLHQTVDAKKEKIFSPDLLIALRRYDISHTVARFVSNCVCHVTYLLISLQGRPQYELSYRGNLHQAVDNYVPNPSSRICSSLLGAWKTCLIVCRGHLPRFNEDFEDFDPNWALPVCNINFYSRVVMK